MDDGPASDELRAALATYGEPGIRAAEMLVTAQRLLRMPGLPRRSEAVAWACREALVSVLDLGGRSHGLQAAAREVVQGWQLTQTGVAEEASTVLAEKIEALCAEVDHPGGYHARRLLGVIRRHTGREPLPQQEAAAAQWARLVSEALLGCMPTWTTKGQRVSTRGHAGRSTACSPP